MEPISREVVEDFLFHEAELIDSWALMEWAELFTDDGEYLVPATDRPDADPLSSLYLIYDDRQRVSARATRLLSRNAHAESPRSRVRHLVGNVRILGQEESRVEVACNFVVYRSRGDRVEVFPGHCNYELARGPEERLRIRRKRAVLDSDTLRVQRKLSIIL